MRLISIGKSPSCTIYIASEYVSNYHAELLLLDNGDILLTDCGSTNGTFLNGKQITPRVEVPVRRGDRIEFDNIALNWGNVPQIPLPDPAKVKGVYGVGKSQRNRYNLVGDSVSRYHATFKEMKNGKWFIQDHSKNGTFVNGSKIPSNQDFQIKAKDSIVCGTVPCPNPVPGGTLPSWIWAAVGGIAAAILVCVILSIIIPHNVDPYKAVAIVKETFAIKVVFADDPIVDKHKSWYLALSNSNAGGYTLTDDIRKAFSTHQYGTAFFVSKDGMMITNKHVVDWIYADTHYSGGGKQVEDLKTHVERARTDLSNYLAITGTFSVDEINKWYKSTYELSVEPLSFEIIYPGRSYTVSSQYDGAQLVKVSDDPQADIAILQLDNQVTPSFCEYFDLSRSLPAHQLKRNETYYTIGFPYGPIGATLNDNKYEPHYGQLVLSQNPKKYTLTFDKSSVGGQSGSPIYDKKHRLIGVLYGTDVLNETLAAPIDLAKELMKDVVKENDTYNKFKSTNAY
ncbi:MAG: FHA domain-containing protein [Bacteroidales bacterium]|nr:FHA domain-containing protein [Bacteroidales bacterium]